MAKSAATEAADLKREMDELGADPVANKVAQTASVLTGAAQTYGKELATLIRRQPFLALGIGMTAAYILGRVITKVPRR